jgi:uncharacterized cupredoxin-like copper-binding protein
VIRKFIKVLAGGAVLMGVALTACGGDSGRSAASTGGAATTGGSSSPGTGLTVVATEYKFDVTGTATGGFQEVTFQNHGKEPHILVPFKLKPGKTSADALTLLSAQQPSDEQIAEVFDEDPRTAFFGTPGLLSPGDAETTVAHFTPGNYVFVCFIPSPDGTPHYAQGMIADLTVGAGNTPAPQTQGTFEITDKAITAPVGVHSGTYAVTNKGSVNSDFNVVGPTNAQISDVDAAVSGYFGSIGSGETKTFALPAPLVAGFSETMPVGATGYIVVDLDKGRYLIGGNSDNNGKTLVSGEFTVS